ncbi:ABC transporter permease [Methanosarcinales archaeon]|nr:MAG: ABC transporter permease [Methanosarcinales archaeon]
MTTRIQYITRKTFRYILSFFVIITLIFLIPRLMPGDPILNILGEEVYYVTPELVQELKAEFGLDQPLHVQYAHYLVNFVQGDWGYSIDYMQPIFDVIIFRLKWTLVLLIPAVIFGAILGMLIGSIAGWKRGSKLDTETTSTFLFFYSMPHYWLAMLFVLIFAFHLDLFPLCGICSGGTEGFERFIDILWHMTLPVSVLTIFNASYNYLIMRNSVVQVSEEGFILTARAKGLKEKVVLFKHVFRNALLPLVTVIALDFGFMVSGVLLVEIVFSWDGMGTLIYDAVLARDYPLLHGCFLIIAICVLVANFLADVMYAVLDPRVRGEGVG